MAIEVSSGAPDIRFMSLFSLSPENSDGMVPNSHILKIGSITLMFDCGVDESYSLSQLNVISKGITEHKVDYLLLSQASLNSVGALPYL